MGGVPTLTGLVLNPQSPGYNEARQDYNRRFPPFTPRYIDFCQDGPDVERAVKWAVDHQIPIRGRSGRHSYEAYSLVDGGLIIDVSQIDAVVLDQQTGIAKIGAGAPLLKVYQELWNQGRVTIPAGSCPTVGVAGLTLGGGFGLTSRLFGLTCDNVMALDMVLADGQLHHIDDQNHPDLMWASRGGGGGNFGIVTQFYFKTHKVADVTIFYLQWPWAELPRVVRAFQKWAEPEKLDFRCVPLLKLTSKEVGQVAVVGQFTGPREAFAAVLAPLIADVPPINTIIRTVPFIEAVYYFGGVKPDMPEFLAHGSEITKFKNTSAFQYQLFGEDAIRVIVDHLSKTPGPATLVQFDGYGGAVSLVSDHGTADPHRRGVRASLQYQAYWTVDSQAEAHINWVESFRRAMLPYTRGAYVNYCDANILDWPQAYYDGNIARLLEVKQHYDPLNVFDYPQGIGRIPQSLKFSGETPPKS
ncbi:MAG: FAD-binding protein [Sulfobacillus benefaciens]|uniref:FAD-binding protein n=1 Tax=Sulfobacillus benefaciens TaxID=453960 RepID=A0A2T2XHF6_9FIRM|nr:MAG: FAD-binding protein [Sulfobacillus benefaciens]